jgi:hypothetical protein
VHVSFVSTNSICQGEQVYPLWSRLFLNYKVSIHFAHQTFKWTNESKGVASVYCVIIGFSNYKSLKPVLYEYPDIAGDYIKNEDVTNINPYLVNSPNVFLSKRSKPLSLAPQMILANLAYDFGHLTFTKEEKEDFLKKEVNATELFKPVVSAYEFLNNKERWCLWLQNIDPSFIKSLPSVLERLKLVKDERLKSSRPQTIKAADTPGLFAEIRQPISNYLAFPITSSENRKYIPIRFFSSDYITSAGIHVIPNATIYDFGILISIMHITWTRYTCGRMKNDFRYSNTLTYNNYPWPEAPAEKLKQAVKGAAQSVLDARALFPNSSLADLYDPNTMPPALVKAHQTLDKAVDQCYRSQPFTSEAKRIEYLFELYGKYTGGLFATEKKTKKKKVTETSNS